MEFPRLRRLTVKFDDALRRSDFAVHRTLGGRLDRWCGIGRHTLSALVLPSLLCALLVLGSPAPVRIGLAAATGLGVAVLLGILMRRSNRRGSPVVADLLLQTGIVLAVVAVVWLIGQDRHHDSLPYRHLLLPLAAALSIALMVAAVLAGALFRPLRKQSRYGDYLRATELFASRGTAPEVTPGTIFTALLTVPFRAPLALLTLPAIATLSARPEWLPVVPAGVLLICFGALFVGGLNERFGMMWRLAQEVFFKGGALLVSVVIVVLAVLRLSGFTYVTTILDTAAGWTIGTLLASAYVLSWWYDYWAHRLLTDQVLALIDPAAAGQAGTAYPIDPAAVRTRVPADGRVLQLHGASRFVAVREAGEVTYFQSYRAEDLLETLAASGAPGGKAVPTPMQVSGRMLDFHIVASLGLIALITTGAWHLHRGEQWPQARVTQSSAPGVSLDALLGPAQGRTPDDTLIVLAASGGGTRAAIYTAAMLEGIAKLGKADDVVLGSGVSGGGAALAYFAGHRADLVGGSPDAWTRYFDTMSQPFIQDVLERASEWRMVTSGRLGMLLAESFETRWHLPAERNTLAQVRDMGLILNTALAGHFDRPGDDGDPARPLFEIEPRHRKDLTRSTLAGGRLLLTNLEFPAALTSAPLEPGIVHPLPIVVRSTQLRLEQAAALNANFPPVFSNAAIDVDEKTRFWVTDGGAVDNRGMEMLLYALRLALERLDRDRLPRIHVVVADASAFSDKYAQDRGISSVTGAGSRFASHLNAELVAAIRAIYARTPDRFAFSYVMMPDRLRESGSFGTHWMLQKRITIHHGSASETISGEEMVDVLRALHAPGADRDLAPAACRILHWSREDASHRKGWLALITALGGRDTPPACATR